MKLIVAKDSTWSIRTWICAKILDYDFTTEIYDLDKVSSKRELSKISATKLVPVLNLGSVNIHDSLAIIEFLNEGSTVDLYPKNSLERALSRSLCAELHSGFSGIRLNCPFTLDKPQYQGIDNESLKDELCRVGSIFSMARNPFMFERESAVDAFYSVLAYRLSIYGFEFEGRAKTYQKNLIKWSLFKKAITEAKRWRTQC